MLRLADLKVLTKLTGVIGLIAVIVGGCIWYAQGRMTQIDDAYSAFIDQEAEAAMLARRTNRLIFELNFWSSGSSRRPRTARCRPPAGASTRPCRA